MLECWSRRLPQTVNWQRILLVTRSSGASAGRYESSADRLTLTHLLRGAAADLWCCGPLSRRAPKVDSRCLIPPRHPAAQQPPPAPARLVHQPLGLCPTWLRSTLRLRLCPALRSVGNLTKTSSSPSVAGTGPRRESYKDVGHHHHHHPWQALALRAARAPTTAQVTIAAAVLWPLAVERGSGLGIDRHQRVRTLGGRHGRRESGSGSKVSQGPILRMGEGKEPTPNHAYHTE